MKKYNLAQLKKMANTLRQDVIKMLAEAGSGHTAGSLGRLGSRLQGHPSYLDLSGLECSSGPLGQGVSVAVGKALAGKMNHKKYFVYCITSDGEHDEGQTWEAIMTAAKYKLDNLIFILDRNKIQIDGYTKEIMPLESLKAKYEAFNWFVLETDGNDIEKVL